MIRFRDLAIPRNADWLTLASIGMAASVLADLVHEALGHGIAALLTNDSIVSISTVAIQTATNNRFVSAAGTVANCFAGAAVLALLRRARKLTAATYFFWIFGAFNLMNCGYLVVSAFLNSGDWASVIAGLAPAWLWRCGLACTGAVVYGFSLRAIAKSMSRLLVNGQSSPVAMRQLVWPAYLAGGAIMTIASICNPISPWLILLSGAGASFGLNAGLLLAPAMILRNVGNVATVKERMPTNLLWLAMALALGGTFVAVLGPGIYFSK